MQPRLLAKDTRMLAEDDRVSRMLSHPPGRRMAFRVIEHTAFEVAVCAIICANVVFVCIGADHLAKCRSLAGPCSWSVFVSIDHIFLSIYTVELLARVYAVRWGFFADGVKWNVIDAIIVLLGIALAIYNYKVDYEGCQLGLLLRVVRIGRFLPLFKRIPTLYMMLRGLAGIAMTMFWGSALIMLLLVMWSVLAMEMIRPINDKIDHAGNKWCADAFTSVFNATLYFFQVILAGDSWGACSIPIIERAPWTLVIFGGALLSVMLGAANLILAVIVEQSVEAREADSQAVIMTKRKEKMEFAKKLQSVLQQADVDRDGTLSLDELMSGYEGDPSLREAFNVMDIDREDLQNLFFLMGADEHVGVSYRELVDLLQKAKLQDMRVYLMNMKLQMEQVAAMVRDLKCPANRSGACSSEDLQYSDLKVDASGAGAAQDMQSTELRTDSLPRCLSSLPATSPSPANLMNERLAGGMAAARDAQCRPCGSSTLSDNVLADIDESLQQLRSRLESRAAVIVHDAVEDMAALARQLASFDVERQISMTTRCTESDVRMAVSPMESPRRRQLPHLLHSARSSVLEVACESRHTSLPKCVRVDVAEDGQAVPAVGHVFARVAQLPYSSESSSCSASKFPPSCCSSDLV